MVIDYKIIRRPRRKTAAICVKPDCSVLVLAPLRLSDRRIAELVQQKSNWISSKISHFEALHSQNREKEYVSGESFRYLGKKYRLQVITGQSGVVKLQQGIFHVPVPPHIASNTPRTYIQEQLECWYREHALARLIEKTERFAHQVGFQPASVGVKGYRTRWGSCHHDGRIYYNWRIIRAPHRVIDYLVVHELAHLVHADHSRHFWSLVERILPDYAERRAWLRSYGSLLE